MQTLPDGLFRRRLWRRRGRGCRSLMVRVVFDVAGAGPRSQLFRVVLVEVLRDGVEIFHLLLAIRKVGDANLQAG